MPANPHIVSWVQQSKVAPVVVVDSLIAFFDGDNENDAKQMRTFLNQSRMLLKAGAAAVIILGHPGKSETAQDYRGSSDIKPAGYKMTNTGDGKLDRILLKAFKARFSQQRREMVLIYAHDPATGLDKFVVDDRPQAVAESYKQVLTNLLQQNPNILKTAFEREAVAKAIALVQVRQWVDTGIAAGRFWSTTATRRNAHRTRNVSG